MDFHLRSSESGPSSFHHSAKENASHISLFCEQEMDYSENSDEDSHYTDPSETYEQELHSSNPGYATYPESSSNWQDDLESKKSQVPNSVQDCMDIANQILPELVEETSAPAKSQQSNHAWFIQKDAEHVLLSVQVPRACIRKPHSKDGQSQRLCPTSRGHWIGATTHDSVWLTQTYP